MNRCRIFRFALPLASTALLANGCMDHSAKDEEEHIGEVSQAMAVVLNGDFETGDVAGFGVRGVNMGPRHHSGSNSARLRTPTAFIAQNVASKLQPGVPYVFSAWVSQDGSNADTTNSPHLLVGNGANCDSLTGEYADMAAPAPFSWNYGQLSSPPITFTQSQLDGPVCFGVTNGGYGAYANLDDFEISVQNGGVVPGAVDNPGLELGTLGGWRVNNVKAMADSGGAGTGTTAMELNGGVQAYISQDVRTRLIPGLEYEFSAWVKVMDQGTLQASKPWGNPRLYVGKNCYFTHEYGDDKTALNSIAAGWQRLSVKRSFTATELTTPVCAGVIKVDFDGLVRVDDISARGERCDTPGDDDGDGVANDGCVCVPNESEACYEGPAGTDGVSMCQSGARTCSADGYSWGPCTGQVLPAPAEVCDSNDQDENCDGQSNEGCTVCNPGDQTACYNGPPETEGVGACSAGIKTCAADGQWNEQCNGAITPATEVCNAPGAARVDEDCDGQANEDACTYVAIAAGQMHSLALRSDGTLWAWGYNLGGMIGDGSTGTIRLTPVQVVGLEDVSAIAAGGVHSMALKNGQVWVWGINEYGQHGDGYASSQIVPVLAEAWGDDVVEISGGYQHTLALRQDGSVLGSGLGVFGELGTAGMVTNHLPVVINGLTSANGPTVSAISAGGYFSLALMSDGTARAWGWNEVGQLGNAVGSQSASPVPVTGVSGASAISAGFAHSLALTPAQGTVQGWGFNSSGQLGDGSIAGASAIAAAGYEPDLYNWGHSLALKDGAVWSWGSNEYGQLGNGTTANSSAPVAVDFPGANNGVTAIAAGRLFSLALKDGKVWAWGNNYSGDLGVGTTTPSSTPVLVHLP